ncbi:hypothetical protein [Microbacterium arborescens]|uniref:hypothetical protein n=1 Tax=Microbacterium arborescens TaxID=33883 RepID=UPI00278A3078|nr:hypothetical protein [Microbacterium arborescens]MDQ1218286.1 pimeloyl-ACP methyl ester carboxylesterase [Microbacterium arborescens]
MLPCDNELHTDSPPDVVMICIHGIGRQLEGQTAREVARSIRLGSDRLGFTTEDAAHGPDEAARLVIQDDTSGRVTLGIVDAWWDQRVRPPETRRTLAWLLRVAPFTVWVVASAWGYEANSFASAKYSNHAIRRTALQLTSLLVFLIGAPLFLTITLLAMVTLWPFKRPRRAIKHLVDVWGGDAWSYRSDLLDVEVIGPVVEHIRKMRGRGIPVVLVGHSQGAEIARRASIDEPVEACVRVGSGELVLGFLRTMRVSKWAPYVLWTHIVTSILLLLLALSCAWRALAAMLEAAATMIGAISPFPSDINALREFNRSWASSLDVVATALIDAGFDSLWISFAIAISSLAAGFLLRLVARPPADLRTSSQESNVMLVKSLWDPVCPGPYAPEALVRYVPAKLPLWREHVSYFEKAETGLALLESIIGSEAVMQAGQRVSDAAAGRAREGARACDA